MDNKQYAWAWKADSQDYSFSHDSIDECLEEARAENDENYKRVYIGIVTEVDIRKLPYSLREQQFSIKAILYRQRWF